MRDKDQPQGILDYDEGDAELYPAGVVKLSLPGLSMISGIATVTDVDTHAVGKVPVVCVDFNDEKYRLILMEGDVRQFADMAMARLAEARLRISLEDAGVMEKDIDGIMETLIKPSLIDMLKRMGLDPSKMEDLERTKDEGPAPDAGKG